MYDYKLTIIQKEVYRKKGPWKPHLATGHESLTSHMHTE